MDTIKKCYTLIVMLILLVTLIFPMLFMAIVTAILVKLLLPKQGQEQLKEYFEIIKEKTE